MNYLQGSVWRKWDLHVHTPASLFHNYTGVSDPWIKFIEDLEALPPEFKVIGINDYLFVDGYKRILAERANGRLRNIDLFLPVIELRLDKFGGSSSHLSRVNYHVIFSDEIKPEIIEQQFLASLSRGYQLSPRFNTITWNAVPTLESLKDLGTRIIASIPASERVNFGSPIQEGFNNLCLSLEQIKEALNTHYFKGKYITAVGKTEWADIKWNDHSIAEKKNVINSADLVFISAEDAKAWEKAKNSLIEAGVKSTLLDCSDAHSFSHVPIKDRIGKCFTWIKADTTFDGLKQIVNEPETRCYVGDEPPKLQVIRENKTKFISAIEIRKIPGSSLSEAWFDNTLQINPDLVAVIGNKGKGKSALVDSIGLLGNTKQHESFSFLSPKNFRDPKNNKARHFTAKLIWESGGKLVEKSLDSQADENQPELIKYIPQNFLEEVCNQIAEREETDFDRELKKVIFSHVADAEKLGKGSLDELIDYKTAEANEKIEILKQDLDEINHAIIDLEETSQPEFRTKIENLLNVKKEELSSHDKSKPNEVQKPSNDASKQQEIQITSQSIDKEKEKLSTILNAISAAKEKQIDEAKVISSIEKVIAKLNNFEVQFETFKEDCSKELESLGITFEQVVKINIDKSILEAALESVRNEKKTTDAQLDSTNKTSLIGQKEAIEKNIDKLRASLDEPNKQYQAYLQALSVWEAKRTLIIGDASTVDSIKYFESQLADVDTIPARLSKEREKRITKALEIFTAIKNLATSYRELYAPVQRFIDEKPLARDKFHLNFEVSIVESGFRDTFFTYISHGVAGTFCGVEAGHATLKAMLEKHDFSIEAGVMAFLEEMEDKLAFDRRSSGDVAVKMTELIRKGQTIQALYKFIYSLDYLRPRYILRMAEKELHQLSPGERGTLLLVFYLLVDKDNIPLVIDQPEENLDNQTVFELLVPCIKEAKKRRQIIIVTHNPNLAVVCDAEQIICASLDKKNNYKMQYTAGAIENPVINKSIVDVLEGTRPAFDNRDSKYQSQ